MYEQVLTDKCFFMLYATVTTMAIIASCYLLFRRGNAFAADITTPARLRRWTAVLFAVIALSHVWYMPIAFLKSSEDIQLYYHVAGLLDSMTFFPSAIIVLIAMLQDRNRPLWPVAVMVAPLAVALALNIATHNEALLIIAYAYFLLLTIGLAIYMVRALRQYSRWLRDNYADLEHKEVWQSFVVLATFLLVFSTYAIDNESLVYTYAIQVIAIMHICYVLWRVETLSDLSIHQPQCLTAEESATTEAMQGEDEDITQNIHDKMGSLLQQHCIDTQLYLQHDLTLSQLAKAIGTNRFYLSQYFSHHGMTYNAYINDLRINHFVSLYREAIAAQRSFTAQQLSYESGYRSYSTFSLAFKQRMGQSVTAWTHDTAT